MEKQRTIKKTKKLEGRGLRTGILNTITFFPSPEDSGIVFEKHINGKIIRLPAHADYVCDTSRGTSLCKDGFIVRTVEHLLAVIRALQIDNLRILIEGEEIPIFNGSAYPFVEILNECEIIEQSKSRQVFEIKDNISIEDSNSGTRLYIEPSNAFDLVCHVVYDSEILSEQIVSLDGKPNSFLTDFAPARTFVFLHEVMELLRHGLIKGGDLTNAIVFVKDDISEEDKKHLSNYFQVSDDIKVENGILGNTTLYFKDEPARHKLVDLMGDLSLVGFYFTGKVYAYKPGHYFNTLFAKEIRKYIINKYVKGQNSSL